MTRIKEAIELCLEDREMETNYPYDFVGVQKITVNEVLGKYGKRKKNKYS